LEGFFLIDISELPNKTIKIKKNPSKDGKKTFGGFFLIDISGIKNMMLGSRA